MQGTLQKQKCGYKWMRIGYATAGFSNVMIFISVSVLVILAIWVYKEIPDTEWHLVNFLVVYLVAGVLYMNVGVWLHEQLHCLAFWGTTPENRTHINFSRKYFLFLSGYYRVRGAINYRIMRRALLAPLLLSASLLVVGWLGSLILPGWWLPLLLSMLVASLLDMIHDFYMYSQIRLIGKKGKYWDTGRVLEVVWKE
jgi:hypothetical protein